MNGIHLATEKMGKSRFVLYLNAWGTAAKLLAPDDGDTFSRPDDIRAFQKHFTSTLRESATCSPSIAVYQLGDVAFATCTELDPLLAFAIAVFRAILEPPGRFAIWPLRGAICQGEWHVDLQSKENLFESISLEGDANVTAARLEKSAQKGMRLFIANDAAAHLSDSRRKTLRPSRAREIDLFEVNWLIDHPRLQGELESRAPALMAVDSNYCRQLAASFNDLIRWAR